MGAHSIVIPVAEPSQVGRVRRMAGAMAASLGWDATLAGRASIVATELANNLVQHAGGGILLLRALAQGAGMEVVCLDCGPGMADVARCLEDGFSTAGTAGTGLGAVRRIAREFDVYSSSAGTAVLARIWSPDAADDADAFDVGVVSAPMAGEDACGDAWAVSEQGARAVFAMVDGLGHGPAAAAASEEAIRVFHASAGRPPAESIALVHAALAHTRGAAMAVAEVDTQRGEVRYAGVGNVAAAVIGADAQTRNMVSHNGTLGHHMPRVREFLYPWPPGALLLMHTDGLTTQRRLEAYGGLHRHHPGVIAGVLYRDFQRGRDDATVLVAAARVPRA